MCIEISTSMDILPETATTISRLLIVFGGMKLFSVWAGYYMLYLWEFHGSMESLLKQFPTMHDEMG